MHLTTPKNSWVEHRRIGFGW